MCDRSHRMLEWMGHWPYPAWFSYGLMCSALIEASESWLTLFLNHESFPLLNAGF